MCVAFMTLGVDHGVADNNGDLSKYNFPALPVGTASHAPLHYLIIVSTLI